MRKPREYWNTWQTSGEENYTSMSPSERLSSPKINGNIAKVRFTAPEWPGCGQKTRKGCKDKDEIPQGLEFCAYK